MGWEGVDCGEGLQAQYGSKLLHEQIQRLRDCQGLHKLSLVLVMPASAALAALAVYESGQEAAKRGFRLCYLCFKGILRKSYKAFI